MKLIIDIPEKKYKKIKEYFANDDCGFPNDLAIAKGVPISKFLEELERKILMEVDGGTDDKYLSYTDICNRISNFINEYKSELKGENK